MKRLVLIIALSLVLMPLLAQTHIARPSFSPYAMQQNMPNLRMSHSMGFEAGTSSRGTGYYLSRYTNHMNYKLHPKLDLDVDLNFVNFGSVNTASGFELGDDNDSKILPEFSLRYQPKDNISFELKMGQGLLRRSVLDTW